jgi:hypothetical protein
MTYAEGQTVDLPLGVLPCYRHWRTCKAVDPVSYTLGSRTLPVPEKATISGYRRVTCGGGPVWMVESQRQTAAPCSYGTIIKVR